jgi:hypothetical protein
MKVFAMLPGLLFGAAVLAQSGSPKSQIPPFENGDNNRGQRLLTNEVYNVSSPGNTEKMPNGNLVKVLPQDNMPCVIPDMSNYNMPVVRPTLRTGSIAMPNPAYPPASNKPFAIDPELLKKLQNKRPRTEIER